MKNFDSKIKITLILILALVNNIQAQAQETGSLEKISKEMEQSSKNISSSTKSIKDFKSSVDSSTKAINQSLSEIGIHSIGLKESDPGKQAVDPSAILTGPINKKAGSMVILKTIGSAGYDPKFTCDPVNEEWYPVQFLDGTIGIMFSTETAGRYTFSFAVNGNNKTALTSLAITIGSVPGPAPVPVPPGPAPGPVPPGPGPVPTDPLAYALTSAAKQDIAAGIGTLAQVAILSSVFKQACTITIPASATYHDLRSANSANITTLIGAGTFPNLRAAIGNYLVKVLPTDGSITVDKALAISEFTKIAVALDQIK